MAEIEIGLIEPTQDNAKRSLEMLYDAYKRAGMSDYYLRRLTNPEDPVALGLETIKLSNHTRRPIGAYVAGELVGASMSGERLERDEAPFQAPKYRRRMSHSIDALPGNPLGIKRLVTLQDEHLSEVDIARALLMEVLDHADGREIRTSHYVDLDTPSAHLLVTHGFQATDGIGRPVGNVKQRLYVHPSSADVLEDFASSIESNDQ